jgi:hypothetical protein
MGRRRTVGMSGLQRERGYLQAPQKRGYGGISRREVHIMKKPRNRTFGRKPSPMFGGDDHYWLDHCGTDWNGVVIELNIQRAELNTPHQVKKAAISLRDWLNEVIEYLESK